MTDTNPRDLIYWMADELDHYRQILTGDGRKTHPLATKAHAYLGQSFPTLTVEDCANMHKHRFNFLVEDRARGIVLDGSFTREDLIEIANTVPTTEA